MAVNKHGKYVVSTLNRDGKTVSKKMLASFGSWEQYCFNDKDAAFALAEERNASDWARLTGSVGRWVVVNTATGKVVTR